MRAFLKVVTVALVVFPSLSQAGPILPGALPDTNRTSTQTWNRPVEYYDGERKDYDPVRAAELMQRATERFEAGDTKSACRLARRASIMMSRNPSSTTSDADIRYRRLASQYCEAAKA